MIKLDKEASKKVSVLDESEPSGARAVVIDTFTIGLVIKDNHANVLEIEPLYGFLNENGEFVMHTEPGARTIFGPKLTIQDIDTKKEFTELVEKVAAKGAKKGNFRDDDIEDFLIEKGLVKGVKG